MKSEPADEIQILKRAIMITNRHEDGKGQSEELFVHEQSNYPLTIADIDTEAKDTMLR